MLEMYQQLQKIYKESLSHESFLGKFGEIQEKNMLHP